jgi:hypothetical protein
LACGFPLEIKFLSPAPITVQRGAFLNIRGYPPPPCFFTKSNKHAGENEHARKKYVQSLDVKELTDQNLEDK